MNSSLSDLPSHEGNVSSLVRKNCCQLFMVYAGLWKDFMPSAPNFLRHCGIGNRNLTILRDPQNSFYEYGVSSQINSIEALAEYQAECIRRMPHVTETYTMGNSAGGHAAITFGCLLGVTEVFAFSPSGLRRLPILQDILYRAEGRTRVNVFFDEMHARDTHYAEALAQCPGVNLVPSNEGYDDGHYVFLGKIERDEMRYVLPPYRETAWVSP